MAVKVSSLTQCDPMEILSVYSENDLIDTLYAFLELQGVRVKSDKQIALEEGFSDKEISKLEIIGKGISPKN